MFTVGISILCLADGYIKSKDKITFACFKRYVFVYERSQL
jgi:hypothetical protein